VVKIPLKIPGTGSESPPKLTGLLLVRHHSRVKNNHKDSLTTARVIGKICRIPLSCSSANFDKKIRIRIVIRIIATKIYNRLVLTPPKNHQNSSVTFWIIPRTDGQTDRQPIWKHNYCHIENSSKHNQLFLLCWRFGLYQRPSSEEEAGTSSSGSCQEPEELVPASDEGLW